MSEEELKNESPWQRGARLMWERRKAEGWVMADRTKTKLRDSQLSATEGRKAVFERMARLEAVLRGQGFSEAEIRLM